jgi:hypothetical protein
VLVALCVLAFTSVALANAPDPGFAPAEGRLGPIVNIDGVDTVRVSVSGAWQWPTHSSDCNTNRTGIGYSVDWNDPDQPGNLVTVVDGLSIDVGAWGANDYNPQDNEVHPTRPEVAGNLFADPADPALYASWHSGCGTYDGEMPLGVWGAVDLDTGEPVTCTSDSSPSPTCLGGSHVYTLAAVEEGLVACVLLYDVHGGDADSGGAPNGEKEVTAGGSNHNGDNGAEANGNLVIDNACAAIAAPEGAPSSSPTVDPAATPDPSASPDPEGTPGPSAGPDPSASPDPSATVDPNGTPGPTGTPDPSGTPDPNGTPGLPETAVAGRPDSTNGAAHLPALVMLLTALGVGVFAALRQPLRNRPATTSTSAGGPWSTTRTRDRSR